MRSTSLFSFLPLLLFLFALVQHPSVTAGSPGALTVTRESEEYTKPIPIYDASRWLAVRGMEPIVIRDPAATGLASGLAAKQESRTAATGWYPPIAKSGPDTRGPGATVRYEITLTNSESVTRSGRLSDTLPAGLDYVPGSSPDLAYDPATRTLGWEGELAPGELAYVIEPAGAALPYLDLAGFGAANLCAEVQPPPAGEACAGATVTFNLGINGYSYTLYGQRLTEIVLSTNGVALAGVASAASQPRWLPDGAAPGLLLAGLWRAADLSAAGRWHAAILSGYLAGHDVFYAQWHDAPHAQDPDSTARHAIIIPLEREGAQAGVTGPSGEARLSGHLFYLYANVAHPPTTTALGYAIGIQDRTGARGVTYAFSGPDHPPRGEPPAAGTTLHLQPVLFGASAAYRRTFAYEAVVNARVPETVANTAVLASDSPDPVLARAWSTHYLYVRRQTFLPLLRSPLEAVP
jgi:uncharacterized repeat protein (TIGR01451 family)